ncbi:MAG: hypothetical protein HQ477_08530 [Chloroflexi bacterium]|nr:hypothetical protein [Chloroflexota bacterium]
MPSVKVIAMLAVVVGIVAGVGFAFFQGEKTAISSSTSTGNSVNDQDAAHILEMHGEEALIETDLGGFETIHNGFSNAPGFLRSQLEKLDITAPEGATTEELQELLAEAGVTMEQLHQ